MTSVAIMQPYFFPYIGYFQMAEAVDTFVFLDDVKYIEHGWSNRNNILNQGAAQRITLPVRKAAHDLTYCEREYCLDQAERNVLRSIRQNYARAPQFAAVMPLIDSIMAFPSANVAAFNGHLVVAVSRFLQIDTKFVFSSDIAVEPSLRGQDKVIAICRALGADRYVNTSGGTHLYDGATFAAAGLELRFIGADLQPYPQLSHPPVTGLSIIDVLMFNPVATIREKLWRPHWIEPGADS